MSERDARFLQMGDQRIQPRSGRSGSDNCEEDQGEEQANDR